MINQFTNSVEIANDSGNPIPTTLPSRLPLLGYVNSTRIFAANDIVIQPFDVTNHTGLNINVSSTGGTTLQLQGSVDGLNWSLLASLNVGTLNFSIPAGYVQTRIQTTTASTGLQVQVSVQGVSTNYQQSFLDNPASSIIPFTTTALLVANSTCVGPYYIGNIRAGLLHVTSTASGSTLQVQLSHDGVNYYAASCVTIAGTPQQATSLNSTGAYGFSTNGALYARVVTTTAITAGTLSFTVSFSTNAAFLPQNSIINITPIASSGVSNMVSIVTAATNNLTLLKASNACVTGIFGTGAASGKTCYLKMFNAASTGAVTMGTTAPILNIGIAHPHSASFDCSLGLRFGTGLVIAITANAALLDNTATAAGDGVWNITFA